MTTPVWNWGGYDLDVICQVQAGTWQSNQYWGGWQDGVVDLAPIGPMVPDDVHAMAEADIFFFYRG